MLNKEIILKKLEQIKALLEELKNLLDVPFAEFAKDLKTVRSSERNFQLIVDLAIDINVQIVIEKSKKTPDSYRQSFVELGNIDVLPQPLANSLSSTAALRNILVHEYDFEEEYEKFYSSAKASITNYEKYCELIYKFVI